MSPERTLFAVVFAVAVVHCGAASAPPRPAPARITDPAELAAEYYRRVNAENLVGVMALLVVEPVLSEPFSTPGAETVHRGYAAVAQFFDYGFRTRDDHIVTEFIRPEGTRVRVGWSLHGADADGVSGETTLEIRDRQIAAIQIALRD